jgi:uncharacterized damage-inducible protein DinB
MISRPADGEYAAFYAGYVARVPDSGPVVALEAQRAAIRALGELGEDVAAHRYAEGKWSVREVLGHLADAERVFTYRLLRIARADQTPLAGFDENQWIGAAAFERRPIRDVAGELLAVREATLALIASLDAEALGRSTVANGKPVSGRALCWILAGHTQHHLGILHDRYGLEEKLGPLLHRNWEPGLLGS